MEKEEASEVTQLSCIVDKYSSAHDIAEQLEMLWNNFADLNRTMKKKQLAWAFFKRGINAKSDSKMHWYYCIMCFSKQPSFLKNCRGIYEYNSQNVTSTIRNHCLHKHSLIFSSFQKYCEERKEQELMDDQKHSSSKKLSSFCIAMSTTKQNSMMKKWLISNDKYASNSKEQLEFEEDVIALTALACTPLSLVEHEAFINLILKRDPRLNMISRTRLSRNLIPKKTAEIVKNVQDMLTHVPAVSLSYDLWMTRRAEEIFSLDGHYITGAAKTHTHLGMPWAKGGTDGQSLSVAVKSCIDKFHLRSKVISYTSDGGGNLKTCKDYLNEMVSNDAIFNPSKPIFEQSCLAHALSGACKKAVIDARTGTLSIEQTRIKLQKCITWTKKSQK